MRASRKRLLSAKRAILTVGPGCLGLVLAGAARDANGEPWPSSDVSRFARQALRLALRRLAGANRARRTASHAGLVVVSTRLASAANRKSCGSAEPAHRAQLTASRTRLVLGGRHWARRAFRHAKPVGEEAGRAAWTLRLAGSGVGCSQGADVAEGSAGLPLEAARLARDTCTGCAS